MSNTAWMALAVMAVAALSCVFDLRERRIPNALTLGATVAALLFHTVVGGGSGAARSAMGWAIGTFLFFPFFLLRGMGAGDVKLIGALGAWFGFPTALWLALYTAVAGGVAALGLAAARGYLGMALANLWLLAAYLRTSGLRPHPHLVLANPAAPRLPYALPVMAGALLTLWLK